MKHAEAIRQAICCNVQEHELESERLSCKKCCRGNAMMLLHLASCFPCRRTAVRNARQQEEAELAAGRLAFEAITYMKSRR